MCDRLVLDSSERDDRHGALLDADMTADALILLERQLKHGETQCAEIMDLDLTRISSLLTFRNASFESRCREPAQCGRCRRAESCALRKTAPPRRR